jgi:hypothetical protein
VPEQTDIRDRLKQAPGGVQLPQEKVPAVNSRLQSALSGGKVGLLSGAAAGLVRSLMAPEGERSYLKNTLAGALLGGGIGGVGGYIAGGDPFQQGSAAAKSFEAGKDTLMERLLDPETRPSEAISGALTTGLAEYLSGKHEFGPAQQKALVQQFAKSNLPTTHGWRRRVKLADRAINQLRTNPMSAAQSLVTLQKVAPDPEMRQFASEALARIRSGRATTPEGVNAMATIAQQMENAGKRYKDATSVIDAMNVMKEMYGAGQIDEEEAAKNLGLISGRFGSKSEEAESLRQLVQSALARPIATEPRAPYKDITVGTPQLTQLVRKAMRR